MRQLMKPLTKLIIWGGVCGFGVVAIAAVAGSQVLPPGTDGPASDCAGQVPIVVGADEAAQSDLYSAATLAGVIETTCIVLAGPRDGEMSADQIARLDAASAGGWVMGGEAAVPESKVAGRGLKRLNGVDRWHTARLAGAIALDSDGDVAALTAATAPGEGELGGGSAMVDGAEVRVPPGLDADCAGQVPIVVAVDGAAQSDLYSAVTLAGVLNTPCIVLAGARGEPMSAEQQARLAAAAGERPGANGGANGGAAAGSAGWIVGGEAAVPPAKVAGYSFTRIGGADRWETARLIGQAAVAQAAQQPAETTTTTTEARSAGGSSGGGSARSSGGGGGGGSSRRVSSGGGGTSRVPTSPPTGTPPTVPPTGTTSTTTTTTPGDATGTTTTTTTPGDATGTPTTDTTVPDETTTTTTSTVPPMAMTFTPTVTVEVPPLDGTATGVNLWASQEFVVTLARASGAADECSLMTSVMVTFTVQLTGTVTPNMSQMPVELIGTTADGDECGYTATFGDPPDDTTDPDFAWTMAAPNETQVSFSAASPMATGTYTVGDVTFDPDATITVPPGNDGAAFDVEFTSSQVNCSGNPTAATLSYTVPTGGTTAQPDVTDKASLIAYAAGATSATDVCSYAVTFGPNENGAAMALSLQAGADTEVSGTDQLISATYDHTPPPAPNLQGRFDVIFEVIFDGRTTAGDDEFVTYRFTPSSPDCWLQSAEYRVAIKSNAQQSAQDSLFFARTETDGTTPCTYTLTWPTDEDGPWARWERYDAGDPTATINPCPQENCGELGADYRRAAASRYIPQVAISVPTTPADEYVGETFDVTFNQAGSPLVGCTSGTVTQTYTVQAGSPIAVATGTIELLVHDPDTSAAGDVCVYTVAFPSTVTVTNADGTTTMLDNDGAATATIVDPTLVERTYVVAAPEPPMATTFTPSVTVEVPQLDGTTGTNIWSGATVEVGIARASDADDDCSLGTSVTVTFTVAADGSVTPDASEMPASLTGTTATGVACEYDVTFPAAPTDTAGGDFDWTMMPAAATPATLSDATPADNEASHAYTVGAVTFAPDATITVLDGAAGLQFNVDVESSDPDCSGTGGSAVRLIYIVASDGTSVLPVNVNPPLVAYPATATAATDVCSYTATFPDRDAATSEFVLETVSPAPDVALTGTSQAISATYRRALMGVSSGETFSCALVSDGSVFCWGDNTHNQLTVPTGPFTHVSAGSAHACGLKTDDTAVCWGDNSDGQATVPGLAGVVTFTQVDAGSDHSCGLKSDGMIECWGDDTLGKSTDVPELGQNETFTQVSAGAAHSCAVKSDRSVECWGENFVSRVPDRTPTTGSFESVSVGVFVACGVETDGAVQCWGNTGNLGGTPTGPFAAVSAGQLHVCGVKTDATVACWGSNTLNQRRVPAASFAAVSVESEHSCGLTLDGSVACWGYGNFNQATSPSGAFASVAGGQYHSCGIKTDNTSECWGANGSMQGTLPTLDAGVSFTQLSAGAQHTCGVKSDNTLACWGNDGAGAGAGRVSNVPSGATDLFTSVAAGNGHSCGVRSGGATDGHIVCWGNNLEGQLDPPPLGANETFTAVDNGAEHSCALKSDMSVVCWGFNGSLQGDGRRSGAPREATDLFSQLSVGEGHACAVREADGTVACWGNNEYGQSTDPTGAFSAVAAGAKHTCAIRSGGDDTGTVVCWGSNDAGQTEAPEGTFDALTAGRFHTCGIRADDATGGAAGDNVVCWGAGTAWGRITARLPS